MATKRKSNKKQDTKPAYVFTWLRFALPGGRGVINNANKRPSSIIDDLRPMSIIDETRRPRSIIDETRPLSIIDDLPAYGKVMLSSAVTGAQKRAKSIIDWQVTGTLSARLQLVPGTVKPKTVGAFALRTLPNGTKLADAKRWPGSREGLKFSKNAICILLQTEIKLR